MFDEADFIPISALQHYVFCKRRAALVHIEQIWQDNLATTEGNAMHERVHDEMFESRGDVRFRTTMTLCSKSLGITGIADVVEFKRVDVSGIDIKGIPGVWQVFPIEYKRGTLHNEKAYETQLCAQALCLEEMLSTSVASGAIYWGETHRRQEIEFSQTLREHTVNTVEEVREFLLQGKTPLPRYDKKCKGCSLFDLCMPKELDKRSDVSKYWFDFFDDDGESS